MLICVWVGVCTGIISHHQHELERIVINKLIYGSQGIGPNANIFC